MPCSRAGDGVTPCACSRRFVVNLFAAPNEEAMLERALAMSLESGEEEQSAPAVPDFAHMTEEEQIAFAMQMSMQDARESALCFHCKSTKLLNYFVLL
jgi:hypothetical protein